MKTNKATTKKNQHKTENQIDRQREPHEKLGVNSCAPESISRSCFTVASGVLLLSEERGKQAGSIFRANLYLVYVATNKNRTHSVYKR
jgi:hypothetical protein